MIMKRDTVDNFLILGPVRSSSPGRSIGSRMSENGQRPSLGPHYQSSSLASINYFRTTAFSTRR